MKKTIAALCLVLCPLLLTGCENNMSLERYSQGIERLELVTTIGVDKADKIITLTAAAQQGEEAESAIVLSAQSASVAGAMESLHSFSSKERLFIAHTKHYVLGEQAAMGGVREYLDYIERDMNMRLNTDMFIVRETTAKSLMADTAEQKGDISQMLDNISSGAGIVTDSYVFSCGEVAARLAENGSALVAAVELIDAGESIQGTGSAIASPCGYGIIKNGCLVDYIEPEDVMGANIFIEDTDEDIIQVEDAEGNIVALIISVQDYGFEPVFENGELIRVNAWANMNASISQVGGDTDIYSGEVLEYLEDKITQQVREAGEEIIAQSQRLEADILRIGRVVNISEPVKLSNMDRSFEDIFPYLEISLDVDTKIIRSYDLMQPVDVTGGDNR